MELEEEAKRTSVEKRSSSDRFNRRRSSRSRSRNRRYQKSVSRSRSPSPFRRSGFRGGNRRFIRRSPFRGGRNFRDRFRRSRSTSRTRFDRKDRRRYEGRRSRSESAERIDNYRHQQQQQQQQQQQMNYPTDPYNYMQNVVPPNAPNFGAMNQFNSYDFQTSYPPPAPNFNNIACPAPPGIHGETWIQPNMAPNMPISEESEEEKKKRDAAIAEEKKRQREDLKRQLDQYISRAEKMKRELKVLKDQKSDLLDGLGKRSPSPKTNGFIKENEKLQSQISSKLAEILDVIDMLNKIIKKDSDEEEASKKKPSKRSRKSESDSPERIKSELLESMKRKKAEESKKDKVNYVYYDPEIHWCKHCQIFPKTAKDYLSHLHSKDHLDKIASRSTEGPWRASFQKLNEVQNYPDAPSEKVAIKGLQFFEPSLAWYCKLCEMCMGDSWCVSLHLKSDIHAQRYNKLIEREPKFEEKWLEARNKAYELSGAVVNLDPAASNSNDKQNSESNNSKKAPSDKKIKKKKNKKDSKKKRKHSKKRKRGSSSSSSDSEENSDSSSGSDSSSKKNESDHADSKNSIRVAMRNILNKGSAAENDERSGKWTMIPLDSNKPQVPPAPTISAHGAKENKKDEQIIGQWSTVEPIISQEEKRLLENLKGRLKTNQKQESTEKDKQQVVEKKEPAKEKEKDRDRDRERDRMIRSRSRERTRNDRNYRGRKSRSRSKSRSPRNRNRDHRYRRRYSRSRSRSAKISKYEKSSLNFPTEPKLPPLKDEKKLPSRSYNSSVKKDDSSSSSLANAAKKMPFIGKMPVFKKQLIEKKNEDLQEPEKKEDKTTDKQKFDEKAKNSNEKWEDLMPDPAQFSAMMNSASNQQPQPQMSMQNDEMEVPPGLNLLTDFDEIPKPISDVPPLKTGQLPKDFQATLDLLFDGDTPKTVIETPIIEVPKPEMSPIIQQNDGPQMIMPEELSQHALLYGNFFPSSTNVQPVPPPPPTVDKLPENNEDDQNDSIEMIDEEPTDKFGKSQEDIDDLALLGIDVNDVGSGLW